MLSIILSNMQAYVINLIIRCAHTLETIVISAEWFNFIKVEHIAMLHVSCFNKILY